MPPAIAAAWIAGLAMLAAGLFAPAVLADGDTFWHVVAGRWMMQHLAVPQADPFSYTFASRPWIAHEWLAELLLAAAWRVAGWTGLLALTGLSAGLAFLQLGRHLGRWLPAGAAFVLLVLSAACITPELLARPHILVLPVFEAWCAGLIIARSARHPPPWRLLPLMCLWANMHASFVIGLALCVPLMVEAVLEDPAHWRPTATRWGGFLAAATLAAMLTPHGVTGLLFPFRLATMPGLARISEWQPMDFGSLQPLELALLAGLYVALTRGVRLAPMRLLIVLGLLHLALHHVRHQILVAFIVPLLIAEPLGAALTEARPTRRAARWHMAGMAIACCMITVRVLLPVTRPHGPNAPIEAVAHVPAALAAQPVFNEYGFGGYLILAGIKPFIDGRADMYGSDFLHRYLTITRPDRAALDAVLRDYKVRWTILSPENPAVQLMDGMPGWHRLYADRVAVVHVADPAEADRTAATGYPIHRP
jgi:hypothetical protein